MNILTKLISRSLTSIGSSGSPGSPAQPGYSYTVTEYVTPYQVVTYVNEEGKTLTYYITGDPVPVTKTVVVPGIPAIAPVAPVPANYAVQMNLGWRAGARSVLPLASHGVAQFKVPKSSIGVVVGLSANETANYDYRSIPHAIYGSLGLFCVMEAGIERTARMTYAAADVFSIQRSGTTVRYYRNSTLIYKSALPSAGTVYLATSMYSGGDSISDASLTSVEEGSSTAPPFALPSDTTGDAAVSFPPLVSRGGDTDGASSGVYLQPLTTDMTVIGGGASSVSMLALVSRGSDYSGADARGEMAPLTTDIGAGWMVPSIAAIVSATQPFTSVGHSLTGGIGQGDVALPALFSRGSDKVYGEGRASMAPMTARGGYMRQLDGIANLTAPRFKLVAQFTGGEANAVFARMPMPTLAAYTGTVADNDAPKFALNATMNTDAIAKADLVMPRFKLNATMRVGSVSGAQLTMQGAFTLSAFGAAHLTATLLNKFTLAAHVTSGSVMRAMLTMPQFSIESGMSDEPTMRAELVMPALRPVPSMLADLDMGRFRLNAVMRAVVVLEYEGYAINLLAPTEPVPGATDFAGVTHYTGMPFNQIVRFGDDYFGVAADGLYRLGGDTDNGEPIAWAFDTCMTDFKSKQMKRAVSMYIGGRIDPASSVAKVHVGEQGELAYTYNTIRGSAAQNFRVQFGKGLKSRYYAFGLEDAAGKFVEVDTLDLEVTTLDRAL